ncbi:hypothetical protein L6164_019305 [Bauhinia variegata]|uniref:Uncharacterized protein n=1 Tax=Bauhinia variegata TaxID=167791 RepID=A0ACB9MRK1_BAUVA|nr:hypothetical protein L6164_019305 [Bauhinia variegata]
MECTDRVHGDGVGIIKNDRVPDQADDTWTVHGDCGCLRLAAHPAAAKAPQLGKRDFAKTCKWKFLKAKPVSETKWWDGSFHDSRSNSYSKFIQENQLVGQWSGFVVPLQADFNGTSTLWGSKQISQIQS